MMWYIGRTATSEHAHSVKKYCSEPSPGMAGGETVVSSVKDALYLVQ